MAALRLMSAALPPGCAESLRLSDSCSCCSEARLSLSSAWDISAGKAKLFRTAGGYSRSRFDNRQLGLLRTLLSAPYTPASAACTLMSVAYTLMSVRHTLASVLYIILSAEGTPRGVAYSQLNEVSSDTPSQTVGLLPRNYRSWGSSPTVWEGAGSCKPRYIIAG